MSERENILARIQEALSVPAPRPGQPEHSVAHTADLKQIQTWLPKVGETFEARLDLFRRNAAALKADFHFVQNREQLAELLVGLRDTEHWEKAGSHSGQLTNFVTERLGLPLCTTDGGYDVADLESCSVGITECDALIAQTGSVLVTNRSAGGRALSVLPPHHVVLAHREQLVADLPEAFALLKKLYAPKYPSFISFITGPSRTGDIERILVLGAHGPRKLTIVCF
jgi:L-lactate dehydrogenase complex protein LldG